mmetsp:Transcript_27523/g.59893  ORF Transcript_27523/g.59893 Transcript_27523/m.59893 type:complete len:206 (+) Transcript_27523:640-1257(+)
MKHLVLHDNLLQLSLLDGDFLPQLYALGDEVVDLGMLLQLIGPQLRRRRLRFGCRSHLRKGKGNFEGFIAGANHAEGRLQSLKLFEELAPGIDLCVELRSQALRACAWCLTLAHKFQAFPLRGDQLCLGSFHSCLQPAPHLLRVRKLPFKRLYLGLKTLHRLTSRLLAFLRRGRSLARRLQGFLTDFPTVLRAWPHLGGRQDGRR